MRKNCYILTLFASVFLLAQTLTLFAQAAYDPLNAVVRLDVIDYRPNYFVPWQNNLQGASSGSGVVIDGNRILTNAHNVAYATYITVTKRNEDEKYEARVLAVDHTCDLALLEVENKAFFRDIVPFPIGQTPAPQTAIAVAGYPIGGDGLSITQGVISRIEVQMYTHSLYNLLAAQLDAAINPGNSGGPVLCNGRVVGIAFQGLRAGEGLGYMIPTEIINHFLKDIEDGRVDGFGYAGFKYIPLENPATRRFLKMADGQTGVRLTNIIAKNAELLKQDDVLMAVDGVKIANNGNIRLPNGEARLFTTLINQKQIGETVKLDILRNGEKLQIELPVRNIDYVCHKRLYDVLPDYYIIGGLVFTRLSYSFLDEWSTGNPPSELTDLMFKEQTEPGEETVVMALVLGDRVNTGYQSMASEPLKKVNGTKIKNLEGLIAYIEACQDEFVTFAFGEDEFPMTLSLKELREATPAILQRYRVPADRSQALR